MEREPYTILTISKQTFDAVQRHVHGTMSTDTTTLNNDGTVSFPVAERVVKNLAYFDPDPELALRAILGMGKN